MAFPKEEIPNNTMIDKIKIENNEIRKINTFLLICPNLNFLLTLFLLIAIFIFLNLINVNHGITFWKNNLKR